MVWFVYGIYCIIITAELILGDGYENCKDYYNTGLVFLLHWHLGSQNQEVVNFNYLIAQGDFHLSTLLRCHFREWFCVSMGMFGGIHLRSQLQIRKLKKQVKKLSPQIINLNRLKPNKVYR